MRPFDLSVCFERAVLLPGFVAVFVSLAVVHVHLLFKHHHIHERGPQSITVLRLKIATLLLAFGVALVNLDAPIAVAQVAAVLLVWANNTRNRCSNTLLLLYWPAHIAALAVAARTDTLVDDSVHLHFHIVIAVLELFAFVCEALCPEVGMESDPKKIPLARANVFSVWSFGWLTPFMKLGAQKYVTAEDVYELDEKEATEAMGIRLETAMRKDSGLWTALTRAYGWPLLLALVLKIASDLLAFAQPQLLRLLLRFIPIYQASDSVPLLEGVAIVALMFVTAVFQTTLQQQYLHRTFATGMRVRGGLVRTIYRKALKLSVARASGDIVNLMSVDAMRLQSLAIDGLGVVSGPLQIVLAFASLHGILGWPAFVGVAVMAASVPLNTRIARVMKRLQEEQMKNRDCCTKEMSEILGNIKSIKLYAWEPAFIQRVLRVRNEREMVVLRRIAVLNVVSSALWAGVPLLVAFASFAVAARTGQVLTSDIIFPAIALFMLLQLPLANFGNITSSIVEALVSARRLQSFLQVDELQALARTVLPPPASPGEPTLEINSGDFAWATGEGLAPTLEGVELSVLPGQLVGILGRVGAGKTSLLSAIVGEMNRLEGEVVVRGSVAYVPQTPWIMSGSVRDNIIFSHAFEEDFYKVVLDACALRPDLETLPDDDLTMVGEKGITLSGGQRARVALARAVYARADLYLLDDVLAAVDSHVARHVFDNVVGPRGILADRARVLVTNTVAFVSQFDELVFMRRGIIFERATYAQAMLDEVCELHKLIVHHGRGLTSPASASVSGSATPVTMAGNAAVDVTGGPTDSDPGSDGKLVGKRSFGKATRLPLNTIQPPAQSDISKPVITKEHTEVGKVKSRVYAQYISAASRSGFVLFVLLIVASQASRVAANVVLTRWGDAGADVGHYIMLYGLATLASAVFAALSGLFLWVLCTLRSARYLHDAMLFAVMRAPLSFFESTPTGRIMNLFSRNVYVVDQVLARVIQAFVRTLTSVLSIIAVAAASFPLFLLSLPPLAYIYHRVMTYYLATSRELKRLDAVTRSPVFAWFSESLGGLSTIRALELLGASIILTASCLALVTLGVQGAVDASLVGLVLSYSLNASSYLNWLVRYASDVEKNIVSVERILHYVDVEPEAPAYIENKPIGKWPSEGHLEFRNYSLRYRPNLDLVLKNINLDIKPREKIGICGRTGAGKSSLLLALFRIIEPASGSILIDGVDTSTLGLHDLRSAISIIPQEPQLFEGTMRENIDPTEQYQDDEIWQALQQVHLKEYIQSLPKGLDASVGEGGASMSSGQRQLLCFARALLRKSTILVLDEATSAVDLQSDMAIQNVLHGPQFASVTILTIAHRLHTITESDRVLVLDNGEVAEFDTPQTLIADRESLFHTLAAEAGLATTN